MKDSNLKVDINNMMDSRLSKTNAITQKEIEDIDYISALEKVEAKRNITKWRELPFNQAEIVEDIINTAKTVQDNFENFVVLGIGGSALGPIAVQQALNHLHYNLLPKSKRNAPRLFVEDNVDPERMNALLDVIDVEKTMFNVITKSGGTSETMSQLLIVVNLLKEKLGNFEHNIIVTTDKEKGNLIKIAKQYNLKTYIVPDGVGGRFSELSPVGLLAAAVCKIDIKELLRGAAVMDEVCSNRDIWQNPALMLATLQYISMKRGKNISVFMPYADSLKYIASWYAQLWAESLGKKFDNNGNEVFVGQTPVGALGVTDQHSQVQLYTEGPFDKVVTFLCVEEYRSKYEIPNEFEDIKDVNFLSGHSLNELISAECLATEYALMVADRPNYKIVLPCVNAFYIGQLLYMLEMQTAYAGEMLNINTYDQPGVEAGKQATFALLGKQGYETKKEELNSVSALINKYII